MCTAVLSTTYFGPIQWYQKLHRYESCIILQDEQFLKQTYRNRCVIATANGLQALTVPVEKGERNIRNIRISDHGNWRHVHWNALVSAYGDSPFFQYYADDIRPFFEQRWTFLYDYNLEIALKMCELLDIHPHLLEEEHLDRQRSKEDFRSFTDTINPKHPLDDSEFEPRRYYQVYEQRHGFQPNLSILDLLFNQGNESILYL